MSTCCDSKTVAFTLDFAITSGQRSPLDGSPLDAYFDDFNPVDVGLEMSHPFTKEFPPKPHVLFSIVLDDGDVCDKPQLLFATGVTLSGTD